jgi:hypothetical protein
VERVEHDLTTIGSLGQTDAAGAALRVFEPRISPVLSLEMPASAVNVLPQPSHMQRVNGFGFAHVPTELQCGQRGAGASLMRGCFRPTRDFHGIISATRCALLDPPS